MTDQITVRIAPERDQVRILATRGPRDLLKAALGPPRQVHPRAAATLLSGLALWHPCPLSVVVCAEPWDEGFARELCDALDLQKFHGHVGIVMADGPRRRRQVTAGIGDLRDLRELCLREVTT